MNIVIPSRGRPNSQRTSQALSNAGVKHHIAVSKNDPCLPEYAALYNNIVVVEAKSITDKRNKILQMFGPYVLMMDDDLAFYARKRDGKFLKAEPKKVSEMISKLAVSVKMNAHVGMVDKFMAQTRPRGTMYSGRYNQVLGYNLNLISERAKMFKRKMPRFRTPLNQEHDMHLQLSAMGLRPAILCEYSKDAKYYAKGGLTGFRTPKLEREVFESLAITWPHFVTLRKTKHSIGGVAATFRWKYADEVGERNYNALRKTKDK